MCEEGRYHVGEIKEREDNQYSLYRFVRISNNHDPHQCRAKRHHDVLTHPEETHAGRDAGKLSHDVSKIGHAQHEHGEKCDPKTEFLPNQIGQTLTGNRAHSRRHLLNDD